MKTKVIKTIDLHVFPHLDLVNMMIQIKSQSVNQSVNQSDRQSIIAVL